MIDELIFIGFMFIVFILAFQFINLLDSLLKIYEAKIEQSLPATCKHYSKTDLNTISIDKKSYDISKERKLEIFKEHHLNNKHIDMSEFKKYRRSQIAEIREVEDFDIGCFKAYGKIEYETTGIVSISQADLDNGSPKIGDMIGRNPKNHKDQWLIAEQYFKDNFEDITK